MENGNGMETKGYPMKATFTRGEFKYSSFAALLLGLTLMTFVPLLTFLDTHIREAALYLGGGIWLLATLMPLGSMLVNELRNQEGIREEPRTLEPQEFRDNPPRPSYSSSVTAETYLQAAVAKLHEVDYGYPYFGTRPAQLSVVVGLLDQAKKTAIQVEVDYVRAAATTDFLAHGLSFETPLFEVQSSLEKTQHRPASRHLGQYLSTCRKLPMSSLTALADLSIERYLEALFECSSEKPLDEGS
jgi:hypothetical protein